jgi:hypothetical protein
MNLPPPSDRDIRAAEAPAVVRAAGGAVLGAGALTLLIVVQTATGFVLNGLAVALLVVLGLLGSVTAASGLSLMRARPRSAVLAVVACVVLLLSDCAWLMFSMAGGLVSAFVLFSPLVTLAGLVLSAVAIEPCRRVGEARARLKVQGLDLGT